MWFTRVSIQNPVFATMMMVALMVLGLFAVKGLPVEQFPDINFPVVVVTTEYPGASPETVELDVSRPIEEVANTVAGINRVSSRSYEGMSVVIVEFTLSTDPAVAAQDVREKIALIRPNFRKEIKESRIQRFDPTSLPVVSIAVHSDAHSLRDLTVLTSLTIKKRFEAVRGVGAVSVVGGVQREVNLYLNPQAMEMLGVGVDQVVNAVRNENQELPSGTLISRDRETVVQVKGRIPEARDFERLVVARRGGVPVYLGQVARAVDNQQEDDSAAFIDGRRAISLDIVKAQSANTIEVVDGARALVEELRTQLPAGVQLTVVRDTSLSIRASVANVKRTLIEGALLTVGIVFLFLTSWRSTVITGLTLPISLIGTFTIMQAMGFTINMLTLMALSLCVGLLIDDAIVVRENIVRHLGMGKDHRRAALDGTREIGLAVLATTFSIVAVFLPVGFMSGIIGRFFHQFGITVACAVLLSMFVSFTLDPMLSSVWYDPQAHGHYPDNAWGRLLHRFDRFQERLAERYRALLRWSLAHRKTTLAIAAGTFFGSFLLVPIIGAEFVPQGDNGEVMVQFQTPAGSSLELTARKVRQVERAMREIPEIEHTYATINTGMLQGHNYATIFGKFKDRGQRTRLLNEIGPELRARLQQIGGIALLYVGQYSSMSGGKPIQLSVQGSDMKQLQRIADQAMTQMAQIRGVAELESSQKAAKPTLDIALNRDLAADLGVGVAQVGATLRPLLAGDPVTSWRAENGESYDVRVRLPRESRTGLDDLRRLSIAGNQNNADGSPKMARIDQIAELRESFGPTQINRRDLNREILLSANAVGRPAGDIGRELNAALAKIELPPGYKIATIGANKDMAESFGYALQALGLAVIFIYLILASQFKSFFQPVAIMMSLPLSLVGVFLALLLARSTLNIFSIIGFIMLMGLVTKNAILLVDFTNQLRDAGKLRGEAIVEAGGVRLRPILMTTLAMIFGMLPLGLAPLFPSLADGAEIRAPMAHAVIGGVITSGLLTLIVVPVVYTYLDDFGAWLKQRFKTREPDAPPADVERAAPNAESREPSLPN